jgi:hypothetical protein
LEKVDLFGEMLPLNEETQREQEYSRRKPYYTLSYRKDPMDSPPSTEGLWRGFKFCRFDTSFFRLYLGQIVRETTTKSSNPPRACRRNTTAQVCHCDSSQKRLPRSFPGKFAEHQRGPEHALAGVPIRGVLLRDGLIAATRALGERKSAFEGYLSQQLVKSA